MVLQCIARKLINTSETERMFKLHLSHLVCLADDNPHIHRCCHLQPQFWSFPFTRWRHVSHNNIEKRTLPTCLYIYYIGVETGGAQNILGRYMLSICPPNMLAGTNFIPYSTASDTNEYCECSSKPTETIRNKLLIQLHIRVIFHIHIKAII